MIHPPKTPPTVTMTFDRSPSPDIPQPVVYARLHHFRGKSSAAKEGKSKQVYNIDALQVVFGREESCDIRIYADNVSRKHCKITIDLLTGQVSDSKRILYREILTYWMANQSGDLARTFEPWTKAQQGRSTWRNCLYSTGRRHHKRDGTQVPLRICIRRLRRTGRSFSSVNEHVISKH